MSAVLFFCTAQVPAQLINKLMEDCALPDPDFATNFFSLVRTPDQPDIDDWATDPPVDGFTTGFLGKTGAELRRFPAERIPQVEHGQTVDKRYAVLDERSMSTQTVVLHISKTITTWAMTDLPLN